MATDSTTGQPGLELIEKAKRLKDQGNVCFREGKVEQARERYCDAFVLVRSLGWPGFVPLVHEVAWRPVATELVEDLKKLTATLHLNEAACASRLQEHQRVVVHCGRAQLLGGMAVKLLLRRGMAHQALGSLDDAWDDLGRAAELEPTNLAVRTGIRKLTAAYAELGSLPPGESGEEDESG